MDSSFSPWILIFLVSAAQGFFIALVLWRWRRGVKLGNRLLAVLVALFSLSMLEYVVYWTGRMPEWPHLTNISVNFTFLYGPLIYLYLRTIYEGKGLRWSDALQIAPFIIASIPFYSWYFTDAATKSKILTEHVPLPWARTWMIAQFWAEMLHLVGYVVWNLRYVRRQPSVGQTSRWATLLCIFHVVFAVAYISYFVLIRFPFFNQSWDYHISAVMTAMIYLIAYAGYIQPTVFEGLKWNEGSLPAKYKNSGLTAEAGRSLLQHLDLLMRQERVYHDPEISLEKLAKQLQSSKHHVSQVINEHLGVTFFEYINQLRVEEAKALLQETSRSDFHVIEIAYAVGFNNKVSFNAAFKKSTGMTPTEYRRNHGASDKAEEPPRESLDRD